MWTFDKYGMYERRRTNPNVYYLGAYIGECDLKTRLTYDHIVNTSDDITNINNSGYGLFLRFSV